MISGCLTLVEGMPLEVIEAKINIPGIKYQVTSDPPLDYFREHLIYVNYPFPLESTDRWVSQDELIQLLGAPRRIHKKVLFYYAKHQIGKGFDFSSLDGKVVFHKGLLVERTGVKYVI